MAYQPPSRTRFYRDKRNGKIMGICAGLADYTGFDVTLVRITMIAAVAQACHVMGGGVPVRRAVAAPSSSPSPPNSVSVGMVVNADHHPADCAAVFA